MCLRSTFCSNQVCSARWMAEGALPNGCLPKASDKHKPGYFPIALGLDGSPRHLNNDTRHAKSIPGPSTSGVPPTSNVKSRRRRVGTKLAYKLWRACGTEVLCQMPNETAAESKTRNTLTFYIRGLAPAVMTPNNSTEPRLRSCTQAQTSAWTCSSDTLCHASAVPSQWTSCSS